MKRSILWFRNDLRLHDNEALIDALKHNDQIIPVYIFDERVFKGQTKYGFAKTGAFRAQFIIDAVQDLRKSFQTLQADIVIRTGKPEDIIPELAREYKTSYIYCNRERTQEEKDVQDALEHNLWSIGQEIRYYRGKMLYYTADLPFPITHCPDIFSSFRKEVEKYVPIREPLAAPDQPINFPNEIDDRGVIPRLEDFGHDPKYASELLYKGGESAALEELKYYLWETDNIKSYKETRNGLLGRDYSSKFSAYLSQGCLSPKQVYAEVKKYESERTKNKSTYWLIFELLWRDFFRFMAKKHGNKVFQYKGIKGSDAPLDTQKDELFERWKNAETGIPFIDANMRELNQTGFMSNRGRQNVASFLIKDLKQNWIKGAEYFESLLLDYDPCSNYGNWNYLAGVGSDPREDRYFNIPLQTKKYDPQAKYIKHWIPELKEADKELLFNPFKNMKPLHKSFDYIQPCIHIKNWN